MKILDKLKIFENFISGNKTINEFNLKNFTIYSEELKARYFTQDSEYIIIP